MNRFTAQRSSALRSAFSTSGVQQTAVRARLRAVRLAGLPIFPVTVAFTQRIS